MIYVVIAIHVIVSLGLILAILLHSGKGTGVSSLFGGGMPSSLTGTSMIEKNLDRITIGLAITFAVTTFVLMLSMPPSLSTVQPGSQTTTQTPTGPGGQQQTPQTPGGAQQSPKTQPGPTPSQPTTGR